MTDTLAERAMHLKHLLRRKPPEWAIKSETFPEASLTDIQMEIRQLQAEVGRIVKELIASKQGESLQNLIYHAPGDLLEPVCNAILDANYVEALPWLLKEYRITTVMCKKTILRLIQLDGGSNAYAVVTEALTDSHLGVVEQAEKAWAAVMAKNYVLACIWRLSKGEDTAIPEGPAGFVDELVHNLIGTVSLDAAIAALSSIAKYYPTLLNNIKDYLIQLVQLKKTAAEKDASVHKMLLLMASRDWDLAPEIQKLVFQAFNRASRNDRVALLVKRANNNATKLLKNALVAATKAASFAMEHLEEDRPDLINELTTELLAVANGQIFDFALRAKALLLVAEAVPADSDQLAGQLVAALRLLNDEQLRLHLLRILLQCSSGHQALAHNQVDGLTWKEIGNIFMRRNQSGEIESFYQAVSNTLPSWATLDLPRLEWVITMSRMVDAQLLGRLAPQIARAIVAQVVVGAPESYERLLISLFANECLWNNCCQYILPGILGAIPERIGTLLGKMPGGDKQLTRLEAGLSQSGLVLGILADSLADCHGTDLNDLNEWMAASPHHAAINNYLMAVTKVRQQSVLSVIAQTKLDDAADRELLDAEINTLLDSIDIAIDENSGQLGVEAAVLHDYVDELGASLFEALDDYCLNFPQTPTITGEVIYDFLQTRIAHQSVNIIAQNRATDIRVKMGARASLNMEKLLLLLKISPARAIITAPLFEWIKSVGLLPVEAVLGIAVSYRTDFHVQARAGEEVIPTGQVLTWGLRSPDGSIIRKAILA